MRVDVPADDVAWLDALHDLLPALSRGLDVRDTFQQLSAIASRIVPHDEANLLLLADDPAQFQVYATTGGGGPIGPPHDTAATIIDTTAPRLIDRVPGNTSGLRSGLTVPVTIDGRRVGVFALLSRDLGAYAERDLRHAQKLASYLALALAHQRLADQARDAAVERERAANIESSIELLRAIADVLDIRTVFPRIAAIANKMLPHDALSMAFFDEHGEITLEAACPADFPRVKRHVIQRPPGDQRIIGDLTVEQLLVGDDVREQFVAVGYRAVLGVWAKAREQVVKLGFFSKRLHAFTARDVPVARRIIDHIALAVSHEQLAEAARQVAEVHGRAERLEARVQTLSEELESKAHVRIVGKSVQWRDVLKNATQVAATDTTVLLTGESGTGKEVVARFVHRASARSTGPFIALNCAALPEQLLESELFGHERGAFTGAQQAKPGQIELSSGGVLFLDEVSEMSLSAQAKFLRVLQEREFQRLGGTRMIKANIRVVAATNRNLQKAVERGAFREDLFYRLAVFEIPLAPLRERPDDILPLSEAFLQEIGKSFGRPPAGLTRDAREALLAYDWPGNVRELHNALERAAIVCDGGLIHAEQLALRGRAKGAEPNTATTNLSAFEHETIARVLRETGWNKSRAAQRLGLSRTQLYVRMRKYRLEQPAVT